MEYRHWYHLIIQRAYNRVLSEKGELHHIIPISLGGTNSKENIVKLTYREHFLCHWLLTKFTTGTDRQKMLFALWRMQQVPSQYNRTITSWQYAIARRAASEATSLRNEGNKYSVGKNKGNKHSAGRKWTAAEREIHARMGGRPLSQEHREKLRLWHTGKKASVATRKKMSAAQSLRVHSEETKRKISLARLRYWQRQKEEMSQ